MDLIYQEMWDRNVNDLETYGNLYHSSWDITKRCVALVAKGNWQINTIDLSKILGDIEIGVVDSFVEPRLHHTFFVVNDFSEDSEVSSEESDEILNFVSKLNIPKYQIIFDKLIPVKTGICLVGHVKEDEVLNSAREKLRSRYGYGERYKLDIFHATIVRWTRHLTTREIDYIIELCRVSNEQNCLLATLEVTELQLLKASWLLQEPELCCLGSVDLRS